MADSLGNTFEGIYKAIVEAQNAIEQHYLGEVKEDYFDDKGRYHGIKIQLPVGENGKMQTIDIPAVTLVPHNGIALKEVEVEMRVALSTGESEDINKGSTTNKKPSKIRKFLTDLSNRNKGKEMAKIKIKFNGQDAPEGLARIKDCLVKIIPN